MTRKAYFLVFSVLVSSMAVVLCLDSPIDKAQEQLIPGGENTNQETQDLKHKASEKLKEVEKEAQSWTDWAGQMISEGVGKAGHAATTTKDKLTETASGGANIASEKASNTAERISSGKDRATESAGQQKDQATDAVAQAKDRATDTAGEAYEDAERKVGEAYQMAKDTMTEKAKASYDAAKEKPSKAKDKATQAIDSEL